MPLVAVFVYDELPETMRGPCRPEVLEVEREHRQPVALGDRHDGRVGVAEPEIRERRINFDRPPQSAGDRLTTRCSPSATASQKREGGVSADRGAQQLVDLADGRRYVASFTPSDLPTDAPADRPALKFARDRPVVSPDATAVKARDLVFGTDARRVPVVDADGHLHGVVAVTTDLQFFACRPRPAPE